MALRNIGNQYSELHRYHQYIVVPTSSSSSCPHYQQLSHYPTETSTATSLAAAAAAAATTTSTAASTTSSSAASQIRTSSPISSPSSDERPVFAPKFIRSVHSSQSLKTNYLGVVMASVDYPHQKQQPQPLAAPPPMLPKYPSMRELAYRKLREQQQQQQQQQQLRSKGRLKLAVYTSPHAQSHLTVHIIEAVSSCHARSTTTTSLTTANNKSTTQASLAYVKITQIPEDGERRLVVKTRVVELVEHKYHFSDKFSFEICQLNPTNRLVIGLWTIDHSTAQGCFSFRIKNLLASAMTRCHEQRPNAHWYHLLPLEHGLERHIKCSSSSSTSSRHGGQMAAAASSGPTPTTAAVVCGGGSGGGGSAAALSLADVNLDLQDMQHLTLSLVKSDDVTYGFSLDPNSCPCRVSRVGPNTIAYRAGLRCGDFISRVNEVNVSRASCESVVKMIKQSKNKLVLEVYREFNSQANTFEPIIKLPPRVVTTATTTTSSSTASSNSNINSSSSRSSSSSIGGSSSSTNNGVAGGVNLPIVQEVYGEEVGVGGVVAEENFARMYASLKYVDSNSNSAEDDDDDRDGDDMVMILDNDNEENDLDAAADKLRRAALHYVGAAKPKRFYQH